MTPNAITSGIPAAPPSLRSEREHAAGYDRVSNKRHVRRVAVRNRAPKISPEQARAELEAAYDAVGQAVIERQQGLPESATQRQRDLVNQDTRRREAFERERYAPKCDDRMRLGYLWPGGSIAGVYQGPFVEKGLRSSEDDMLKRIVSGSPAPAVRGKNRGAEPRKQLWCGAAKDDRHVADKKWRACDALYLTSSSLTFLIRVDIDRVFKTEAELRSRLLHLVIEGKLPCMPHIISWFPDDTRAGQVIRPHLLWILPADRCVYGQNNVQRRLYFAVAAGLTAACVPLGADEGGLCNPEDFKNPLSPHAAYRIWNRDHMPDLGEMAECMDVTLDREAMMRAIAVARMGEAGIDGEQSQAAYTWAGSTSYAVLRQLVTDRVLDPAGDDFDSEVAVDTIVDLMMAALPASLEPRNAREREATRNAIRARATWAVETFNPDRFDARTIDRGAASHLIEKSDVLSTRQAKGGTYAASVRRGESDEAMTEAFRAAIRSGGPDSNRAVAEAAGLSISTVKGRRAFDCRITALSEALVDLLPQSMKDFYSELETRSLRPAVEKAPKKPTAAMRPSSRSRQCWEGDSSMPALGKGLRQGSLYKTNRDGLDPARPPSCLSDDDIRLIAEIVDGGLTCEAWTTAPPDGSPNA